MRCVALTKGDIGEDGILNGDRFLGVSGSGDLARPDSLRFSETVNSSGKSSTTELVKLASEIPAAS
jgi:hypothetical protein